MAKDPAFLFYPGDWMGGTMHLDFECKGAYLELLMLQFNVGHMTYHMIGQVLGQKLDKIWPQIKSKFETDGEKFWNKRLELEKEKRIKYSESRRNNIKGVNQYTKKRKKKSGHMTTHMGGHMIGHMENENENENINKNRDESENKKGDFKKFMTAYGNWTKEHTGLPPKINGADGKALSEIIKYLEGLEQVKTGQRTAPEVWQFILDNHSKWDPFNQKQIKLTQINSNLPNIIYSIKNGKPDRNTEQRKIDKVAELIRQGVYVDFSPKDKP